MTSLIPINRDRTGLLLIFLHIVFPTNMEGNKTVMSLMLRPFYNDLKNTFRVGKLIAMKQQT